MHEADGEQGWSEGAARCLAAGGAVSAELADLLLAAGDAVLLHDGDGLLIDANPAAERLLGWPRESLRGRPGRSLVWPGAAPRLPLFLERACRGERVRDVPAVVLTRDARLEDVRLSLACVRAQPPDRPAVAALLRREPGAGGKAPTARQRDAFLAMLGHELRNPLAALDGCVGLLERGQGDPARLVPMLRGQVRQLAALVDDLVDVARVMRGKIRLVKRGVELGALVEAAAQGSEAAIEGRRQRLVIRGPRSLALEADPTRVQQIVANLVSNATRHTPDGGRISVRLRAAGDDVEVRVSDSGSGLDAGMLERLFEPFVQARPGAGGLGIGLPLSRGLAELHGGTLSAASAGPDRGSTFTLRLPRGRPVAAEPSAGTDCGGLAGLDVLVVDDHHDAAASLVLLLAAEGCRTREAHGGREALAQVAERPADAVLLDLGLPDVDGYEVARQLRSRHPGIFLVAVTGFVDDDTAARVAAAGFDRHLSKPVAFAELCAILARGRRKASPAP